MDKLDYFALTCLILSVVSFLASSALKVRWQGRTIRNIVSDILFCLSLIMIGLFSACCVYLWASFCFTL
jgi:hypothetical protein